ncbi:hypothetical protein [Epilithonimonas sp. UC225_85]
MPLYGIGSSSVDVFIKIIFLCHLILF